MASKADVQAAVAALKDLVDSLPDDTTVGELEKKIQELLAQTADLQSQLDSAKAAFASDEAKLQKAKADVEVLKADLS